MTRRAPRVLVVDDNVDLAENVSEILQEEGFEVDVFERPADALAKLAPGKYDVALLDIRMPGMDGVELYRRLKALDPALPAVAMTAYAHDDRIRAAIEEGIIGVLPKPLDVPRLLGRLASLASGDRALLVEDDIELAANIAEVLTGRGFSVRSVHSCEDARRVSSAWVPAMLLVDVRLPDGDGIDLVEELCRREERCTAVVFSGYARELADPHGRAAAHGATFMEKPLDIERLLAALR